MKIYRISVIQSNYCIFITYNNVIYFIYYLIKSRLRNLLVKWCSIYLADCI